MEDVSQSQIKESAFWMRTLHMILFAIAYGIAETIIVLLVLVQFFTILFTGRANEALLRFGNSLITYARQILRFQAYNTEQMPFPYSDWPQEPPEGEHWRAGRTTRTDTGEDPPSQAQDKPVDVARSADSEPSPAPRPDASDPARGD